MPSKNVSECRIHWYACVAVFVPLVLQKKYRITNEFSVIRNALFWIIHINSKKNRRENLNSSIDRKLDVEFGKNNEKFWKKIVKAPKIKIYAFSEYLGFIGII